MVGLTAKEVGNAVNKTASRIKQLRANGVIHGVKRGTQYFFDASVIAAITALPENRGKSRKKKVIEKN
jgi:hypothetical protein